MNKFFVNGFDRYWDSLDLSNVKIATHLYKSVPPKKSLCPPEAQYVYISDEAFINSFEISLYTNENVVAQIS